MNSVNHEELKTIVEIYYKSRKPLFIWGPTGIGKSTVVKDKTKELAKSKKLKFNEDISKINDKDMFSFIDVRISQLEPSDLRGLPKITEKDTKWIPPAWLPKNDKAKGIIFFDELNLAAPSIQAACYQLILDRRLGEYVLPENFVILSAGNRAEDRARTFAMAAPLQNRFGHVELEIPTAQSWAIWAIENDIDTRIISYVNYNKQALFKYDASQNNKSFATPRTWHMLSDLLENTDMRKDDEIRTVSHSIVGEGVASEFLAFLKLSRKMPYEEILKNPTKVKQITSLDEKYVLLGGLIDTYKEKKKEKDALEKVLNVANYMESEFAVLFLTMLFRVDKDRVLKNIRNIPVWKKKLAKRYGKILRRDN